MNSTNQEDPSGKVFSMGDIERLRLLAHDRGTTMAQTNQPEQLGPNSSGAHQIPPGGWGTSPLSPLFQNPVVHTIVLVAVLVVMQFVNPKLDAIQKSVDQVNTMVTRLDGTVSQHGTALGTLEQRVSTQEDRFRLKLEELETKVDLRLRDQDERIVEVEFETDSTLRAYRVLGRTLEAIAPKLYEFRDIDELPE